MRRDGAHMTISMVSLPSNTIAREALRPADILLSLGDSATSDAIQKLDRGTFSHAALWAGAGRLIESTTPSVVEHTLEKSLGDHRRRYVYAFRHKKIGSRGADVVAKARTFVGRRYSYSDLILVTILMAKTSFEPPKGQVNTLQLASFFGDLFGLNKEHAKELVTCTELVVRSFWGAHIDIRIMPSGGGKFDGPAIMKALKELSGLGHTGARSAGSPKAVAALAKAKDWSGMKQVLNDELAALGFVGKTRRWDDPKRPVAANTYGAGLVTPRFLAESDDLDPLGYVVPPAEVGKTRRGAHAKTKAKVATTPSAVADRDRLPTLLVQTTYFHPSDRGDALDLGRAVYDHLTHLRTDPLAFGPGLSVLAATHPDRVDMRAAHHVLVLPVLGESVLQDEETRTAALTRIGQWHTDREGGAVKPIGTSRLWDEEGARLPVKATRSESPDAFPLLAIVLAACELLKESGAPMPSLFVSQATPDGQDPHDFAKRFSARVKGTPVGAVFQVADLRLAGDLTTSSNPTAGGGVLLAVRRDAYASRPWWEQEILWAKEAGLPTLTVDLLEQGEQRSFPYAGNGPTVVWRPKNGDDVEALDAIALRAIIEWLRAAHFRAEASRIGDDLPEPVVLARPPELFDMAREPLRSRGACVVLYPDPEVSAPERQALQAAHPRVRLVTPSTVYRAVLRGAASDASFGRGRLAMADLETSLAPLYGRRIALSLSNSPDAKDNPEGYLPEHVNDVVALLARQVISAGAEIAYGGNLRKQSETPQYDRLLEDLIAAYNDTGVATAKRLYSYLEARIGRDEVRDRNVTAISLAWTKGYQDAALQGLDTTDPKLEPFFRADVRRAMEPDCFGRILVGGKSRPSSDGPLKHLGYAGPYPGLVEEAFRSLRVGNALYVVGGFGGAARVVARLLDSDEVPEEMLAESYSGDAYRGFRERAAFFAGHPLCKKLQLPRDMVAMAKAVRAQGRTRLASDAASTAWNGLSVAENRALFELRDPVLIARLVLKGLLAVAERKAKESGKLEVTLVRGNITQLEPAQAVAVAVFSDAPLTGAGAALDRALATQISRAHAERRSLLQIPESLVAADWLILGDLGETSRRNLPATIERCSAKVAALARRHSFRNLALVTFGGSSHPNVVECAQRMLAGFRPLAGNTKLQWFEMDPAKFEQLRSALESRSDVALSTKVLATGSTITPTAAEKNLNVWIRLEEGKIRGAIVPPDNAYGIELKAKLSPAQLDAIATPDAMQVPDAAGLEKMGAALAKAVFGEEGTRLLERYKDHRLVIAHDVPSGRIPFETLRVGSHRFAMGAGIVRRPLFEVGAEGVLARPAHEGRLNLLLIANPTGDLNGTALEAKAIRALIKSVGARVRVHKVLEGREATRKKVRDALADDSFDIVHYSGHAYYAGPGDSESGIVCSNGTLTLADLPVSIGPRIAFVNGCQSGRTRGRLRTKHGFSSSFVEGVLRAGVQAYVGTFWPVGDLAAKTFATKAYTALVTGSTLNEAVRKARNALDGQHPDWADYILYGAGDFRLVPRA
jgi:CHAT domain-containing protein